MTKHRQDVDLTHHVAMRLKPAGRAAVFAPPRFVAMLAVGTRLARVVFVDQLDHDPFGCRFVLHVIAELAMVPAAHAAVLDLAAIDSIGDVPDVS